MFVLARGPLGPGRRSPPRGYPAFAAKQVPLLATPGIRKVASGPVPVRMQGHYEAAGRYGYDKWISCFFPLVVVHVPSA